MSNNNEIIRVLGVTAAAFPNFTLLKETARIYAEMLSDIPGNVLEQAAKQLIAESKFFPTVAEFREMSHKIMAKMSNLPTAYDAWQEAIEHCRLGNYTGYSHPLIEKAVQQFGIPFWRSMLTDQEMATRAQFVRAYEALLEQAKSDIRLLPGSKILTDQFSLGSGE